MGVLLRLLYPTPSLTLQRVFSASILFIFLLPWLILLEIPEAYGGSLSLVTPMGASSSVTIYITGTGFNTTASNNEVTFIHSSGSSATAIATAVTTLDSTTGLRRITVKVPAGLPVGTVALRVRNKTTGEVSEGKSVEIIEISLPEETSAPVGTTNRNVRITGSANTKFVAGSTRSVFGTGVTVNSTIVESPTSLVANITISPTATVGTRNVGVITSTQTALRLGAFTVLDVNRPPQITSQPITNGRDGNTYEYSVAASDPDGNTLTFSLTQFPSGMSVNSTTGLVSWTPTGSQIGTQQVTVLVSDGRGGTVTQAFEIQVVDLTPPLVNLNAPGEVLPGSQVTVMAQATDNAAIASVTFEVNGTDPSQSTSPPYQRVITVPPIAPVGTTIPVKATAHDPSGNTGSAEATMTIVSQPDTEKPVIHLNLPPEAALGTTIYITANAGDNVGVAAVSFLVEGVIILTDKEPPYQATYQIPSGTPTGTLLAFSAQAVDFADNIQEAGGFVTVVQAPDTAPPTVALSAPNEIIQGGTLLLSATSSDDIGVASVTFFVDGVEIFTDTQAPYQTSFSLLPGIAPGTLLRLQVRAIDFSRLETADFGETLVIAAPSPGRGVVAGEVYDDTTGLPMEGASAQLISLDGKPIIPPVPEVLSDERGRFRLPSITGLARIRITKSGFTESERTVQVINGKRTDPFDSRLIPLDVKETIVSSVLGAMVSNLANDIKLVLAPGALSENRSMRVTPVNPQGLAGRLPLGWSPVAALDIFPRNLSFSVPASVSVPTPSSLPAGSVVVARWDETLGAWIAIGNSSTSADGKALTSTVTRSGQYAFLIADSLPDAPPPAVVGQAIPGLLANPPPDNVTAVITPSPRILFAQPGVHSDVGILATPPSRIPSGTALGLDLRETFNFLNGTHLYPDPQTQDLTLYAFPTGGGSFNLRSESTVTPSRSFAPFELQLGVIDLAVRLLADPKVPIGTIIGPGGGTASAPNGERVVIPSGATQEDLPVVLSVLTKDKFSAAIPAGLTFLGSVALDLHGGIVNQPVTLSIPAPSDLSSSAQVLVVQLVEAEGISHLALVGLGKIQGIDLVIVTDPRGDGSLRFPGIRNEGRFAFLQADVPLGFVTGILTGSDGLPLSGAPVSLDTLSIIALTDSEGRYVLATTTGGFQVTAIDPNTKDISTRSGTVDSPESVSSLALSTAPTPPSVVSVTPANGAQNVPLTSSITAVFSEPVDPASITQTSVTLSSRSGLIPGTLSITPDNRTVTFRPNTFLVSQTTYQLTMAGTIKDLTGNPMGTPFVSQFTTVDLTPPPPPPAGNITATIPDQTGTTTVTGTQGTVEPGGTAVVSNLTTGALTTLTPNADGSFSGVVPASPADKLELIIRDAAGNQTKVALGSFRNLDGSVVVGSSGGTVEGPGGVTVDIPPGALPDGTVVKVEPVAESDLALPVPADFPFVGGVRLNLGGVKPRLPLDLAVPAPPNATMQDQVLVTRVVQLPRRLAWTVVDRAHLINGKYQTASPPLPGTLQEGPYVFVTSNFPCISYVTVTYKFGFDTIMIPFIGPFVYPTATEEETATIAAVCDSQFNIQVVDPNTDQVIQQITQHAPAVQDDIFFAPGIVTDDAAVPIVVWTNVPSNDLVAQVEILFSESMDPDSVRDNFRIKDNNGFNVNGTVELQQGNTLAVFTPDIPFNLGEQYVVDVLGSMDIAGNPVQFDPINFTIFEPRSINTLLQELEKCSGNFCVPTGATDVAYIGDTLFVANGLRTLDEQYADPTSPKRLLAFNVSNPFNPVLIGFHPTATNPRALAVVPNASFTLPDGNLFTGDILVVVGGGRIPGGELPGKLEVYDVTACTHYVAIANCLDGAFKGHKLLSTPAGLPPKPGVPPEAGIPLQVATLVSRDTSGFATTAAAYVVTVPIGLEAVDIANAFNFPITSATDLGPDGIVLGDFLDVAVLKNRVLAIGVPGGFAGADGFRLLMYSPQLSLIDEIDQANGLPGSLARVAGGENFVFDIDEDGNLGLGEEQDQDSVKARDELFDLAIVSSGPLTEGCPTDIVPCGKLYVIDLSSLTDLGHPGVPSIISQIFLPGPAFSIQIDPQAKLAYVEVRGHGLAIVDLSHLLDVMKLQGEPPVQGLLDQNDDDIDDRILDIVSLNDIILAEIKVDVERGIAYINGASSGVKLICVKGTTCVGIRANDVTLRTEMDRINGVICPSGGNLVFDLLYDAEVTIKVDGNVIIHNTVLQQDIPRTAGRHSVLVTPEMVPLPGEHDFEITAVFKENPEVNTTVMGKIIHEVVTNASLPVGHTMIKGVDIWDGHLTHSTQDIMIPGRGLSLDFIRIYSSAGNSSDGPLGAGWTHSYNIRLVHDSCGRFVVIGGEGTGNAFTFDGTAFRPQIGYHSTLVRDPQNTGRFDFFTKAHVQYRFERELLFPGEVYTLRFIQEPNGNRITLDYLSGDGDPTTLDAVIDSSGRSLVLEYQEVLEPLGVLQKRIRKVRGSNSSNTSNLLGLEIAHEYDIYGNLTRVTRKSPNPGANLNDERVEVYTYTHNDPQDRHNLLSYTDPNGNTTNYDYFAATDDIPGFTPFFGVQKHEIIKSIRQPEDVTTHLIYNFLNNTRVVTDPRAPDEPIPPTAYTINNYGATVRIEQPLGKVTIMEWCTDVPSPACPDRNGNPGLDVLMIKKIDAESRTHLYEYGDRLGNLTKEIIQFTGNKAPVTLKDGITLVNEVTTTTTYEPMFSKITSKTDMEGNTTVFLIDADYPGKPNFCPDTTIGSTGNLLGVKDAVHNVTCYTYADNGNLETVTDPRQFVTRYTAYDNYGNPTEIRDPEGNVTRNSFDERSRVVETSDTFSRHMLYAYDGLDRKIREERLDDLGEQGTPQVTHYRYRPNGEPETTTDGLEQVTRYLYDALNRNVEKHEEGVLQVDGTTTILTTRYGYDKGSNLISEILPRCSGTDCITRIHTYDALNRRVRTDVQGPFTPNEVFLATTYDRLNNKLTETDLHGHQTTYVYDGLYRIVEANLPFPNTIVKTAYDRMGNKVRETDANGQPMTYLYDNIYRLMQKTDADGNKAIFAYDEASNKVREENLSSGLIVEWEFQGIQCGIVKYDGLNRPKGMRQKGPGLPSNGYETCYDYEDSDNALLETNPRGFKNRSDKDGLDRLFQTLIDLDGLKLTTTFSYDGNGNIRSVQDPQGVDMDVTNEYDGLNRKIRSTYVSTPSDGGQPVTEEFVYDGNSNMTRYKDKRGIVFTSTYDNLDRVLTKKVKETITNGGAELTTLAYAYDDPNTKVTETEANGNAIVTYSDGLHRPRIIDDPDPNATFDPNGPGPFPTGLIVYEYDGVNKRGEIDKKSHRTEYDYDAINRLVDTREFDLTGTLMTTLHVDYLDQQNQKKETDRRGIVTTSQFDALQRLVQIKRSGLDMVVHYGTDEVLLEKYEYDENSNKVTFIDGQGNRTEFTYDGADRQVTVKEGVGSPVAATTTTAYDNVNNVLTVKDGRNHGGTFDMQYTYDARYRKVTTTNGEGESTVYAYDANNNLIRMTEPRGSGDANNPLSFTPFTTRYTYDELNTLLAVDETPRLADTTAAGITRFFYDGNRNKIAQQDANGNLTTYKYDALNRLTDTFQHTVSGNLTDATTRGSSPTGNPAGGDEATAFHWHSGYDLNSNQNLIVDAKGQRVESTYDYLDREANKSYSQHAEPGLDFQMQSIAYTYDGNSNVESITEVKKLGGSDVTEVTLQTYDPLDRLQTRIHRDYDDAAGKRIEYDYDIQGNRTKVIDPDGISTTYTYDARNRLSTATTEAGTTKYTYWEDSLVKTVEYPNGSVADHSTANAYDKADRSTLIVNRPADPTQPVFSSYIYAYDDNGNRLTQVEVQRDLNGGNSETTTYSYDNLNRLLSVTYGSEASPAGKLTYSYEPNGNRQTEQGKDPHTGQSIDRIFKYEELPGKAGLTFNHVNALSQIVDNLDPSQTVTYEYDRNLNQTAKEKAVVRTTFRFGIRDEMLAAGETATPVTFDYDHNGMRIKKTSGGLGGETRYLYDDQSVLVEYGGSAAVLRTFHKYDYGYDLLSLTAIVPTNQTRNSQFYLTDGLRSTANLTDETGGLLHSYRYDAWGRILDQVGTSLNPRQYTGHYTDSETGLHYFGARYYDDETGRFLSQDPYLGEGNTPPSLHRYLYAYANPLVYIDLRGYESKHVYDKEADIPEGAHYRYDEYYKKFYVIDPEAYDTQQAYELVLNVTRDAETKTKKSPWYKRAWRFTTGGLNSHVESFFNAILDGGEAHNMAAAQTKQDCIASVECARLAHQSPGIAAQGVMTSVENTGKAGVAAGHVVLDVDTFVGVGGVVKVTAGITKAGAKNLIERGAGGLTEARAAAGGLTEARAAAGGLAEARAAAGGLAERGLGSAALKAGKSERIIVVVDRMDLESWDTAKLLAKHEPGTKVVFMQEIAQGKVQAPLGGTVTIMGHSGGSTIGGRSPAAIAKIFKAGHFKPEAVELLACKAACGSSAQELSNQLNVPVRATKQIVRVRWETKEGIRRPVIKLVPNPELSAREGVEGWITVTPKPKP